MFKRVLLSTLLAAMMIAGVGYGEEGTSAAGAGGQPADTAPEPSLELLEFLAEWEADDGSWVGPEFFEQLTTPDGEQGHEAVDESVIE